MMAISPDERHALAFEAHELLRPEHDHESDEADDEAHRLHAGEFLVGQEEMREHDDEKRDGAHQHAGEAGGNELCSPGDEKEWRRMTDEAEPGEPCPQFAAARPLPPRQDHDDRQERCRRQKACSAMTQAGSIDATATLVIAKEEPQATTRPAERDPVS